MGYVDNTVVILYCNPYQPFGIHRSHNAWFDEYNFSLSIEDKHTLDYLLFQQYPKIIRNNLYLINFIPCELDLASTIFLDAKIIPY